MKGPSLPNADRHPHILSPEQSVLVVIDVQEAILAVMHERERLAANVGLLVQAAGLLGVPVLATTQYAARLGGVAEQIAAFLPQAALPPVDKLCFSCAEADGFLGQLAALGRRQALLCGVETHICVAQTALDLTYHRYQVHVAADAVSSRTLEKHKLGMERMRDCGVLPCAAEAAVYELLRQAGTPEFKAILPLVKP